MPCTIDSCISIVKPTLNILPSSNTLGTTYCCKYNSSLDDNFFVDEYLEGLHNELRATNWLHQRLDLDIAYCIALMMELNKRRHDRHVEHKEFIEHNSPYAAEEHPRYLVASKDKRVDTTKGDVRISLRPSQICITTPLSNVINKNMDLSNLWTIYFSITYTNI
jgi:hypothetical protein